MSLTTKLRRIRKPPPEGWDLIEPTLEEFEAKMREAETDPHEGKRRTETLWPIFRIHHQRTRYIYDLFYKREAISRELYEFCLAAKIADAQLIAKWKKQGYENLCCLSVKRRDCIHGSDIYLSYVIIEKTSGASKRETPTSEQTAYVAYLRATRDIPCGEVVCLDTGKVVSLDDGLCCYCLDELPENHRNSYCYNCVDKEKLYGPFEQPFMDKLQDLGMFRLAVHIALSYPSEEIQSCLEAGEFEQRASDIIPLKSDSLAAVLSLQIDAFPVDLSSTNNLVKDFVSKLEKHPYWGMIAEARRLDVFRALLRSISSRLMTNAHTIYFTDSLERRSEAAHSESATPSGVGLFPIASWFNHSCRANLNSFFHGNKLVFVSTGIRKGEEVCDNYGVSFFKHTSEERKACFIGYEEALQPIFEKNHISVDLRITTKFEHYGQYADALPDGHKTIETIAELHIASANPLQRLYLYEEIIRCQRRRGLHFSSDQIRIHLNCALAYCDIISDSAEKTLEYETNMQTHLFAALVRMRTFYGQLYPAYSSAMLAASEFIQMQESGSKSFAAAIGKLRSVLNSLKPTFPPIQ
ncbi:G10 protein [Ostertagia ostertagi]